MRHLPTRRAVSLVALIALAAATGCKAKATGTIAVTPDTSVAHTQVTFKRGQKLSSSDLAALRTEKPQALLASGMTRTEVAVVQNLPLPDMVAMGWNDQDTKELAALPAATAQDLGMAPAALAALKQLVGIKPAARPEAVEKALAGTKAMAVTAAAGGSYASADGSVLVTIPPGALTEDAQVRFARLDTSGFDTPNVVLPGIRFAVDLGDAKVAPGKAISVKVRADDRMVAELKKRDAGFTPDKFSLSQDAAGAWFMTMPVNGPSPVSVKAPTAPVQLSRFQLFEQGSLPLPAGIVAANSARYGLQATTAELFQQEYGRPAPTNMDAWFEYEHQGVFDCGTIESSCWGLTLLSSLGWPIGQAAPDCPELSQPAPTPQPTPDPTPTPGAGAPTPEPVVPSPLPTPEPIRVYDLPTRVTFTSDDPAVDGQPAAGATVTFTMLRSPLNGPDQVLADAAGNATTFAPLGSVITAIASIDLGPRSGPAGQATVSPGMSPVALTVPKNSPGINVRFESVDSRLGRQLTLNYTLDGVARTATIPLADPSARTATSAMAVIVPDDAAHAFALKAVTGEGLGTLSVTPPTVNIQRNGTYDVAVKMFSTLEK